MCVPRLVMSQTLNIAQMRILFGCIQVPLNSFKSLYSKRQKPSRRGRRLPSYNLETVMLQAPLHIREGVSKQVTKVKKTAVSTAEEGVILQLCPHSHWLRHYALTRQQHGTPGNSGSTGGGTHEVPLFPPFIYHHSAHHPHFPYLVISTHDKSAN
jgi:hypothetical protein